MEAGPQGGGAERELLHLGELLVAGHVVVPVALLRLRVPLGPGAAGPAPARVREPLAAAEDGTLVGRVLVRVTQVVVDIVVVDALEWLALAVPVAAQRLQVLLPQILEPLGRVRWQVRLHA